MYKDGYGSPVNYEKAFKWYKMASDSGNAIGQTNIADMYYEGLGVERDYDESIRLYRLAAEAGDKEGQMHLGIMHLDGFGTEINLDTALEWFEKSLENGYEPARVYIDQVKTRKLQSRIWLRVESEAKTEREIELEREAREAKEQIAILLEKLAMKDSEIEQFIKTAKIDANAEVPIPSIEVVKVVLAPDKEDEKFQKQHCRKKPLIFFKV
ncbi:MAG: sel1 repeat family protein [Paenibacillus sp.]|nr:sel1 repeat family protein [Paenibacillus sp.]